MFRYLLVLLLINTSYHSLGNPLPTPRVTGKQDAILANLLNTLAGSCENVFVSNQIKSKIEYCSNPSSSHVEKQLQCLIFYDISSQLCQAIGAAKLALPESEYTAKINEEQDVNSFCLTTNDWVFSNLTEFSRYKLEVDKIFKHPVSCGKICGVEDLLSDDTNFFCKFFKWGTDMIKLQVTTTSTQDIAINNAQLSPEAADIDNKAAASVPSSGDLQVLLIKDTSTTNTKVNVPTSNSPVKNGDGAKADLAKPESSSLAVNQNNQPSEPASPSNVGALPENPENGDINADNIEDTGAMPENFGNPPSKSPEDNPQKVDTAQKPVDTLEVPDDTLNKAENTLKTEEKKQLLNSDMEPGNKKPETLKIDKQNEPDYQDSDEGKEGLDTQGDDDGEEPPLEDLDTRPEDEKTVKKAEPIVSTIEQGEFYGSPIQDAFPESEDHFFPFFLTAVILVVLLYVLYHNKNKVGKVFFGLMLEGRQATRRRNSRGHAYRRLDTLEQAMSANSAAPPSKIIY